MWCEKVKTGYKFVERYKDPLTGRSRRVSITMEKDTTRSRKAAQKTLTEKIKAAVEEKKPYENITLEELIEQYRTEQKAMLKPSTCRRNYFVSREVLDVFGRDTLANAMTANYIRTRLISMDRSPEHKNELLKRFKGILRWGYTHDLIGDITYLDKIERFKVQQTHREKIQDKFLEAEELSILLAGMNRPIWRAVTEFLVLSGLRFGEFAALEKTEVCLKDRNIHTENTYDPKSRIVTAVKTPESRRDVYMQDELLPVVKQLDLMMRQQKQEHRYDTNLFVCNTSGGHIKYCTYNKYLQENSLRILGRKITPHTLRHTHASLLMEQGVAIDTISRRLGHADSRITRLIYLHVTERLKERENAQLKKIKLI